MSFTGGTQVVNPSIRARNFQKIHGDILAFLEMHGPSTLKTLRKAFLPAPMVDELGQLIGWEAIEATEAVVDDEDQHLISPATYGLNAVGRDALDECRKRKLVPPKSSAKSPPAGKV